MMNLTLSVRLFVRKLLWRASRLAHAAQLEFEEDHLRKSLGKVGSNVTLREVKAANPSKVTIGSHVYIGPKTQLEGIGPISIEDFTIISSEVYVLSSIHNYEESSSKMVPYDEFEITKPVNIGRASWIGARAVIMPGVTLGEGCIVGTGAVVTKSWPAGTILAGVPAKPIRQRDMKHFHECCRNQQFYIYQKSVRKLTKIEKE